MVGLRHVNDRDNNGGTHGYQGMIGHSWPVVVALLWCVGIVIGHFVARGHEALPGLSAKRVIVSPLSAQVLRPIAVPDPSYLRWRDIASG